MSARHGQAWVCVSMSLSLSLFASFCGWFVGAVVTPRRPRAVDGACATSPLTMLAATCVEQRCGGGPVWFFVVL